jgi:transposase InsO family protein
LLADLGVTKTHSRPHVSNDNPYSESQFRTLKYRPEFPYRFGCIQDSRAFSQGFSAGTTKSIATPAWAYFASAFTSARYNLR